MIITLRSIKFNSLYNIQRIVKNYIKSFFFYFSKRNSKIVKNILFKQIVFITFNKNN